MQALQKLLPNAQDYFLTNADYSQDSLLLENLSLSIETFNWTVRLFSDDKTISNMFAGILAWFTSLVLC